jgi:hypothetical protein
MNRWAGTWIEAKRKQKKNQERDERRRGGKEKPV